MMVMYPQYLEIETIWIENGRNIEHMNYDIDDIDNDIGSFWVCEVSTFSVAEPTSPIDELTSSKNKNCARHMLHL